MRTGLWFLLIIILVGLVGLLASSVRATHTKPPSAIDARCTLVSGERGVVVIERGDQILFRLGYTNGSSKPVTFTTIRTANFLYGPESILDKRTLSAGTEVIIHGNFALSAPDEPGADVITIQITSDRT
jgi:hypothetical protein